MSTSSFSSMLPEYQEFLHSIAELSLPISASELHGIMCGYLCAGANHKGEAYLRALMSKKNASAHEALLALFAVYTTSQQQMENFNFEFQLLLPDEYQPLLERAQAFSEWCEGFTQGFTLSGIDVEELEEEETKEALQHLTEFAQLDYEALDVAEDDERALVEVSEYARIAVMRIYSDLHGDKGSSRETAH